MESKSQMNEYVKECRQRNVLKCRSCGSRDDDDDDDDGGKKSSWNGTSRDLYNFLFAGS